MGQLIQTDQTNFDAAVVDKATQVLMADGVVVFPTDSVYGIAAAATPENPGYARIFDIKQRPSGQTLPWLIADPEDLLRYGRDIDEGVLRIACAFWPGALTLVVKASDKVPAMYKAQDNTLALRIPDCDLVRAIIRSCGVPLATTSANTHGYPSPASAADLENRVIDQADLTLAAGATPKGEASTIVRCQGRAFEILRQGAIAADAIRDVFNGTEG